ncbi:EutN/CcmL family microcompartment protein [Alkalicoccus chagannorensis]|uniref:EutN/CcmL family microcompartment protein n=1 Tax=Alkalicoccus chagannorensis TaxID=427072 RepID=UPI0004173B83|nr:EutN/CcmL family microcompartment protein [Alkalicoccus chagannorensis]
MKLAKVKGNIVSTIKTESHQRYKLMLVEPVDQHGASLGGDTLIAADGSQAGTGDTVLIVEEGGSVRQILGNKDAAIDAVIVGIVDTWEG